MWSIGSQRIWLPSWGKIKQEIMKLEYNKKDQCRRCTLITFRKRIRRWNHDDKKRTIEWDNGLAQRKRLFNTRCKHEGKVCNIIIDSRSMENLVWKKMIQKLKLEKRRHPNPYMIAWVKDDQKLWVYKKCLVI